MWEAWDFTGNSELVDMVWIHYLCYEHSGGMMLRTTPIYKACDSIVTAPDLDTVSPNFPLNNEALLELLNELADYGREWGLECDEGEFPSRTILRFRPSDEDFSTGFKTTETLSNGLEFELDIIHNPVKGA